MVQHQVHHGAQDHAAHGVLGPPVRPDDGGEGRAEQLKRHPPGQGAQVGHRVVVGGLRGAEEERDLGGAESAEQPQGHTADDQQRHGVADGVIRLALLPPSQAQADIGGAAVPQHQ